MLKQIFFLLFVFLIKTASAQTFIPLPQPATPSPELMRYYIYCNQATRAIYQNDFPSAELYYDSAFTCNKKPFFFDIRNAILVHSRTGEYEKNTPLIKQLFVLKKMDANTLLKCFSTCVFSDENHLLINKLEKKRATTKNKPSNMNLAIKQIFDNNQASFDIPVSQKTTDTQLSRDSFLKMNFELFTCLMEDYGYPDENKTGVFDLENMDWYNRLYIIFWQFLTSEQPKDKRPVVTILENALKSGQIHPVHYAKLMSKIHLDKLNGGVYQYLVPTVNMIEGKPYKPFYYYTDSLQLLANTNRLSIGLDSFETTQQYIICEFFGSRIVPKGFSMIPMVESLSDMMEDYHYDLVKSVFDQEKQDLATYEIQVGPQLKKCQCKIKVYDNQ